MRISDWSSDVCSSDLVMGFAPNADGKGGMGVEAAFNDRLTDAAMRGQPFAMSIDSRVQGALESELYAQLVQTRAKGAGGVILDANSGEVIAMASIPVFDPNKLQKDRKSTRLNSSH